MKQSEDGSISLGQHIRKVAKELPFTVNGEKQTMTSQQALLLRLSELALKGDLKAIAQLLGLGAAYNDQEEEAQLDNKALPSSDADILKTYIARQTS